MPDREKVIKGFECCHVMVHDLGPDKTSCGICPYKDVQTEEQIDLGGIECIAVLHDDALALLKEQEAVEPILIREGRRRRKAMRLERFRSIIHNTGELKKLIEENPDMPLLIFAGDEANSGDYAWMCCTEVSCEKTEVLDCKGPKDERLYMDREELEDDVGEELFDEVGNIPDEEFEKLLKERMKQYEGYWTDVIVLWVN